MFPPRNGTFGVKKESQVSIEDLKMVELGVCTCFKSGFHLNGSKYEISFYLKLVLKLVSIRRRMEEFKPQTQGMPHNLSPYTLRCVATVRSVYASSVFEQLVGHIIALYQNFQYNNHQKKNQNLDGNLSALAIVL